MHSKKLMFISGICFMVLGGSILGYFGYHKISREKYKKHLMNTSIILEIPDLHIKAPVLEGTDGETLKYAAGHFENTGDLGSGNYCIAGHSSTMYACIFDNLKHAETGMQILLYSKEKVCFSYTISEIRTIPPEETSVLDDYGDDRVTLITCNDDGSQRICVVGLA